MQVTVEYKTETKDGKEYQIKITRERGLQEVVVNGKPLLVESATYIERPGMGTSCIYTPARPKKTPEEEAAFLDSVREVATSGLIAEGIW